MTFGIRSRWAVHVHEEPVTVDAKVDAIVAVLIAEAHAIVSAATLCSVSNEIASERVSTMGRMRSIPTV